VETLALLGNDSGIISAAEVGNKRVPNVGSIQSSFHGVERRRRRVDHAVLRISRRRPHSTLPFIRQEAGKSGFDIVTSIVVESSCCLGDDKPDSDVDMSTTTAVNTNGGELLSLTAKAVLNDESTKQKGVIAYFLPRNTDGIILGQSAISSDIKGSFEMEQNVVNGKVKTVTTYFGGGIDDKQED